VKKKKVVNVIGGLFIFGLILATYLLGGIGINNLSQIGFCYLEGGSGYIDTSSLNLMAGTLTYTQMPFYHDAKMAALSGSLAAGFLFLILWAIVACCGNPKRLLTKKVEFSLFSLGFAQFFYGFGALGLLLSGFAEIAPPGASILALELGLVSGIIYYRKEIKSLFKVVDLKTGEAKEIILPRKMPIPPVVEKKQRISSRTERILCVKCGKPIPKKYNFCGYCGTPKTGSGKVLAGSCLKETITFAEIAVFQ